MFAVNQWITSCHKKHMTICLIIIWGVDVTSLRTTVSAMLFHIKIIFILKVLKSHFKGAYDKRNLTLVVILHVYEIYETCQMLVSIITYENRRVQDPLKTPFLFTELLLLCFGNFIFCRKNRSV